MKVKDLIIEALEDDAHEYAKEAHKGVVRKLSKEPYITHPEQVVEILSKYKGRSKNISSLKAAAYLHDTLEDDKNTTTDRLKSLFGELVTSLVEELTSDKKKQKEMGKDEYLAHKMISMSNYGLVLKLCDRISNISDLNKADEKFKNKYKKETEFIVEKLEKNRQLTGTQKKLVEEIKKILEGVE